MIRGRNSLEWRSSVQCGFVVWFCYAVLSIDLEGCRSILFFDLCGRKKKCRSGLPGVSNDSLCAAVAFIIQSLIDFT